MLNISPNYQCNLPTKPSMTNDLSLERIVILPSKDAMSNGIMMSIREQMYQKTGHLVFWNNIYSSKWNLTIEIKVLLEETLAQCWFPTQDLMKIFIDTEFDSWAIFSGTHDSFTQLFRNKFMLCCETEYILYDIVISVSGLFIKL